GGWKGKDLTPARTFSPSEGDPEVGAWRPTAPAPRRAPFPSIHAAPASARNPESDRSGQALRSAPHLSPEEARRLNAAPTALPVLPPESHQGRALPVVSPPAWILPYAAV